MRRYIPYAIVVLIVSGSFALTSNQGSGPNAATRTIVNVTDGNSAHLSENGSDIRISNVLFVATEDGSAVLVAHIVNRSETPDELVLVSSGTARAELTGQTVLRTNTPLHFEGEQANAKAVFIDGGAVPGNFSSVTFSFANAGRVTIQAKIVANTDIYEGVIAKASL